MQRLTTGGQTRDRDMRIGRRWHHWLVGSIVLLAVYAATYTASGTRRGIEPAAQTHYDFTHQQVRRALLLFVQGDVRQTTFRYEALVNQVNESQRRTRTLQRLLPVEASSVASKSALAIIERKLDETGQALAPWQTAMRHADRNPGVFEEAQLEATRLLREWPEVPAAPGTRHYYWVADSIRVAGLGIRHGTLWPVRAGQALTRPAPLSKRLRLAVFPYHRAPLLAYVLTLAATVIGCGYAFCWLSMRLNRPWISYLGLAYFLYWIAFVAAFVCVLFFPGMALASSGA